jgi:D-alanine-D-alanine ligase
MAGRRIRVGVIFGGRSGEHDVSITSAHAILNAVDPQQYEAVPIGINRDGGWIIGGDPLGQLAAQSRLPLPEYAGNGDVTRTSTNHLVPEPESNAHQVLDTSDATWVRDVDVIFPVLHGPMGEDGTIQGMLELAGIPYVGAGVLGSAVAMDKITAKRLWMEAGLPVGPWIPVMRRDWKRNPAGVAERIAREVGYPCFVKPSNLGSSVGITKVHAPSELADAIETSARLDRRLIVETAIDARELEVSVLGNDDPISSVVGEIVPGHEFYDYEAKYLDDRSELHIPADIPDVIAERIRSLAIRAFDVLACSGMARVDFFLERGTNRLLLNEMNTIPGFTPISMYPKLWEAAGISFSELVSKLIDLALERHDDRYDE